MTLWLDAQLPPALVGRLDRAFVGYGGSVSVVKATGDDGYGFAIHAINQAMFLCNATRPQATQVPFQAFRFANAFVGLASSIFDEPVDSF